MPTKTFQKLKDKYDEYPDDVFKDSRMSLGEHIEELRTRMFHAIKWLLFFMVIGFILDGVGWSMGNDKFGIGMPMIKVINDPVESQVEDFYNRRNEKLFNEKIAKQTASDPAEIAAIRQKLKDNEYNISTLTSEERRKLYGAPDVMPVFVPVKALEELFGPRKPGTPDEVALELKVYPAHISYLSDKGMRLAGSKNYLSTLSVQEGLVVYFKVQILCGIVLASPFLFYQFWAFVGAGLYPHEKKYVYFFFGPSVVLFVGGALLCQFVVLPGAVQALLKFNEMLGFDPEIRVGEWLSLAIILPIVFGLSFQTPLVMIFFNRIGVFSAQDYLTKWPHACMALAFFSAMITPTPDVITMMYLFVPMFGLYFFGILICHLFPGFDPNEDLEEEPASEVAV